MNLMCTKHLEQCVRKQRKWKEILLSSQHFSYALPCCPFRSVPGNKTCTSILPSLSWNVRSFILLEFIAVYIANNYLYMHLNFSNGLKFLEDMICVSLNFVSHSQPKIVPQQILTDQMNAIPAVGLKNLNVFFNERHKLYCYIKDCTH